MPRKEVKPSIKLEPNNQNMQIQSSANVKREQPESHEVKLENGTQPQAAQQQQLPQVVAPPNVQQPPPGFELDLSHSFHFPSPAVVAAMNQQIALMNQALPLFLQHGSMYAGAPSLMFAPGLPPGNFMPPDLNSPEAKKQRLHHSMRMLKDEPVPEDYIRFQFNEDCRYQHCDYREYQTHFHCMRQDCGYSFCDKTHFVQHTARHERLDTLMGGDFQQYRANVPFKTYYLAKYFGISTIIVSPRLQKFLEKMLVRDPAHRATAAQLLEDPLLMQAQSPSILIPLMRGSRHTNC